MQPNFEDFITNNIYLLAINPINVDETIDIGFSLNVIIVLLIFIIIIFIASSLFSQKK